MHYKKISNADWKIIEDKFEKKLSSWKGNLLSIWRQASSYKFHSK
jgi:hypothetical protein